MVWDLRSVFAQRHRLAAAMLGICLVGGHSASASDFTADYWVKSPASAVCKTTFTPLPPPRFVPKTEVKGKSVVRSDTFRETDVGSRYFTGNVKVQNDDLLLTAQELEWLNEGPLSFEHGLSLYHDRAAMSIEEAVFDLEGDHDSAQLGDLSFVLFDFPLQGRLKSLNASESSVEASDLSISGCDPTAERWGFRIKRIRVNRETSRVTIRGAGFYVGKVPLFYLPYFTFKPQEDREGIDTTRFDYRSDNGLIVEQPIRFTGANAAVEIAPRYLSKNGFGIGISGAIPNVSLQADWIPNDKEHQELHGVPIDQSRWRVQVDHEGVWRELQTIIDFNHTSDFAYQHDYEYDSLTQPQFATINTAALRFAAKNLDFDLIAQRFESTSEDHMLGERYPELNLRWRQQWGALSTTTRVNTASYRYQNLQSHRGFLEQSVTAHLNPTWGEFEANAAKSITRFSIDQRETTRDHTRHINSFDLSAGVFLDKHQANRFYTLEPRLYYINRDFTDSPLQTPFDQPHRTRHASQVFGSTRISGLDHIPGEHHLATGVRFHSDGLSSRHLVRAELAHTRHFDGFDGESGATSGWAAAIRVQNESGFAFEHRQYHSDGTAAAKEYATLLAYEANPRSSVYATVAKRLRDDVHHAEVGFRWPLAPRWEAIGAFGFDNLNNQITDTHLGLAFNGCCYRTLLFVQRAVDWDFIQGQYRVELENRVMFRFDLGGLGKVGRKHIESLIDRKRFGIH